MQQQALKLHSVTEKCTCHVFALAYSKLLTVWNVHNFRGQQKMISQKKAGISRAFHASLCLTFGYFANHIVYLLCIHLSTFSTFAGINSALL